MAVTSPFLNIPKDKDLKDGGSVELILKYVGAIKDIVILSGDVNLTPNDKYQRYELVTHRFKYTAISINTPSVRYAQSASDYLAYFQSYVGINNNIFHNIYYAINVNKIKHGPTLVSWNECHLLTR